MAHRRISSTDKEIIVGIPRDSLPSSDPQRKETYSSNSFDEYIPRDAGVIDVEDYGITPSASPMDPALWANMIDRVTVSAGDSRVFWFKYDGVYEFTGRLDYVVNGTRQALIEILGNSRDGTIIRLAANSWGYGNPYDCPKSFIRPDSLHNPTSPTNNSTYSSIRQCTVEIGAGNPGCIAIEHNANNIGHIRNVRIRSEDGRGVTGIGHVYNNDFACGPSMVKNVIIEGFDFGISTIAAPKEINSIMTYEDVDIVNPNIAGVSMFRVVSFALRKIRYRGKAPAILARDKYIQLVLLDSTLEWTGVPGVDSCPGAIYVRGPREGSSNIGNGAILIRNLSAPGFSSPVITEAGFGDGVPFPGSAEVDYSPGIPLSYADNYVREYIQPAQNTPIIGSPGTLGIAIEETPELIFTDPSEFASIDSFGATRHSLINAVDPANSSRAAIQSAIDSGKAVIYAQGSVQSSERSLSETVICYGLDGPIYLRGNVQKFMSLGHALLVRSTGYTGPLIIGDSGNVDTVEIYGWASYNEKGVLIQLSAARSWVLRYHRVTLGGILRISGGAKVFAEDVSWNGKVSTSPDDRLVDISTGSTLYARQLNIEDLAYITPLIVNDGGDLWVLGYKTEIGNTMLENKNGARAEILGCFALQIGQKAGNYSWINRDSQLCFSWVTATYDGGHPVDPLILEEVDSVVTNVTKADAGFARPGTAVSLYTGQKP